MCRKLRDVRAGDRVVCGLEGIRVTPEFRERDRADFAFMTNEISSERRVEASVARIAAMMRHIKAARAEDCLRRRTGRRPHRRRRLLQRADSRAATSTCCSPGNALAVHDAEQALFGTSLGVDLEAGTPVEGGHRHHMRAINAINRAGGIRAGGRARAC